MKIAVLGAGGMGNTVIEHLKACPDVKGIVAYDIHRERLAEKGKRYGIPVTTDLRVCFAAEKSADTGRIVALDRLRE